MDFRKSGSPFQSVKEPDFLFQCRGDPWSPTEKRSFSGFPKENNGVFALRRWILPRQNPRASEARPYTSFFDMLKAQSERQCCIKKR
jgi:hypothetical protein